METDYKKLAFIMGSAALFGVTLYTLAGAYNYMVSTRSLPATGATITVSGQYETTVKPDIAMFSFSVDERAKTVEEAQKLAEDKIAPLLESLKGLGIEEKDIKTGNYNVNPNYVYDQPEKCAVGTYCAPKQRLDGYIVNQSINVKVRNLDNAGKVLGLAGEKGISNVSGPNFTIDDIEKIRTLAKAEAIKNAREKAELMAESLGVEIEGMAYFGEEDGGIIAPMYKSARADAMMAGAPEVAMDVSLPEGEETVTARVSVTYNISE